MIKSSFYNFYFTFTIFSYLFGIKPLYFLWAFYSFIIVLIELTDNENNFKFKFSFVKFSIFLFVPIAFLNLRYDSDIILQIGINIISFITMSVMSQNKKINLLFIFRWNLYFAFIFLFAALYYVGFSDFPYTLPFENIFIGSSSNGVTTVVLILNFAYQVLLLNRNKKTDNFASLLTILISLAGYGRGAIIASIVQFLGGLFINTNKVGIYKKISFFLFVLSMIIYNYESIEEFVISKTKIGGGIEDLERQKILNDYTNISFIEALFGRTYEDTVIDKYNNGNAHNSMIRIHHLYGIFGVIYFLYWSFRILIYKNNRDKTFKAILFLGSSFFLRIFTEILFFGTIMDVIFFSLINDKLKNDD